MNPKILVTAFVLTVLPLAGHAHAPKVGHNGGPQTDAGTYHVEVVAKGTDLVIYLHDHFDKPVSSQGFKGTAIFVIGGKTERISLTPGGDNTLKGTATVTIPATPKGAVQIIPPTGSTVQAKFN
jgi:hypothetical protein